MQERITHVCKRMKDAGLVQLLVTDPAAIFYLTGKMIHPGERFLGLLLNTDGTHRLFVNILFPVPEELGVEKIRFSDTDAPMELVARYLDRDGAQRRSFCNAKITFQKTVCERINLFVIQL